MPFRAYQTLILHQAPFPVLGHFSDMARCLTRVRYALDSVAKVVLLKVSKIMRAAGAFFV
jgi:hypothetical protein